MPDLNWVACVGRCDQMSALSLSSSLELPPSAAFLRAKAIGVLAAVITYKQFAKTSKFAIRPDISDLRLPKLDRFVK